MPATADNANEVVMEYIQTGKMRYLRVDAFSGECDLSIVEAQYNPERITLQVIAAETLDDGMLDLAQQIWGLVK